MSDTISEISPTGGITTFATSGLSDPTGLAFDGGGNLFVANYGNGTISKITIGAVVSQCASG